MVTDGVTETRNSQRGLFGKKRLAALFADCRQRSLEETAARIDESVTTFREGRAQDDDVTIVRLEMAESKGSKTPSL